MGSDSFTIWSDVTLNAPPGMVAGQVYVLGQSAEMPNSPTLRSSLMVHITYHEICPDITAGTPSFKISALVETKSDGIWVPLAYQFSPVMNSMSPPVRVIRMQPDMSDFNAGIDDCVYPLDREIARISRQQGLLPGEAPWRLKILITDYDPTNDPFQYVRVSAAGERYDHV